MKDCDKQNSQHFSFSVTVRQTKQSSTCARVHSPFFLSIFSSQMKQANCRNLSDNREKDGFHNIVNQWLLFNVCGSCCKCLCINAVRDKGLIYIRNLLLNICCLLVENKTERRRKSLRPWTQEWQCTIKRFGTNSILKL